MLLGLLEILWRSGGALLAIADGQVLAQLDDIFHLLLLRALLRSLRCELIRIVIIDGIVQVVELLLLYGGAMHARIGIRSRTLLQTFSVFQPIIWFFAGHWLVICDHLREGRDFPIRITVLIGVAEVILLSRSHIRLRNLVNSVNQA